MMTHALDVHSVQHLVGAIVAARESARVRLHLLSLEARDDWQELESQLDCLQSRIEYEGARIKPSAADKVRELTAAVAEFLHEHTNASARERGRSRPGRRPNDPVAAQHRA